MVRASAASIVAAANATAKGFTSKDGTLSGAMGGPGRGKDKDKDKAPKDKRPGIKRSAAGEVWFDPELKGWPDNDYRIFVGNLGPEVTDDALQRAFSKYPSFAKSRVR
jgi:hypothetical protein